MPKLPSPDAGTSINYLFLTSKERDNEIGLDYFGARYYSSIQGRFTSVDPENIGAHEDQPQSWNGYAYVQNDPLRFVDPVGLERCAAVDSAGRCTNWVGEYDGERSKEISGGGYNGDAYWNDKTKSWETRQEYRDRTFNPLREFISQMQIRTAPIEPLGKVGVAVFSVLPLTGPAMLSTRLLGLGLKLSGRIAFRSVDDLIAAAGKLKILKHGEGLGTVQGNAKEILEGLAESYGASVTTSGSRTFLRSGNLEVTLYKALPLSYKLYK